MEGLLLECKAETEQLFDVCTLWTSSIRNRCLSVCVCVCVCSPVLCLSKCVLMHLLILCVWVTSWGIHVSDSNKHLVGVCVHVSHLFS